MLGSLTLLMSYCNGIGPCDQVKGRGEFGSTTFLKILPKLIAGYRHTKFEMLSFILY